MSCTDNKDGSCSVEYIPYEPGTYSLNVTYGGHQVPGECLGGGPRVGGRRLCRTRPLPHAHVSPCPIQGAPSRCR